LAITASTGDAHVGPALESAVAIDRDASDLDILVLDDCNPTASSSALAGQCSDLKVGYYRSPRPVGSVRNVNLGLQRAIDGGYDFVITSSLDVIYAASLVEHLISGFEGGAEIGSVTAWSNNAALFSLANDEPDVHLAEKPVVDWLAAAISGEYRGQVLDVPTGVAACMLIPTTVLQAVGLMDPIFDRGDGGATDWSLRCLASGRRNVLAPSAFVYQSSSSARVASYDEAIIDMRYPLFRSQVAAFVGGGQIGILRATATARIIRDAGAQYGYEIDASWFPRPSATDIVRVLAQPDGRVPVVRAAFRGFSCEVPTSEDVPASIREFFHGVGPRHLNRFERGPGAPVIEGAESHVASQLPNYPGRV
jgi:GT2 family glycosyltransferase